MLNTSVAPWPSYSEEEQQAVIRVLASNRVNYWTGEETRRSEEEFAEWAGSRRAVALFNGTVALDLALKALEIGEGDEVVVTPRIPRLGVMRGELRSHANIRRCRSRQRQHRRRQRRTGHRPDQGDPPGPSWGLAV